MELLLALICTLLSITAAAVFAIDFKGLCGALKKPDGVSVWEGKGGGTGVRKRRRKGEIELEKEIRKGGKG